MAPSGNRHLRSQPVTSPNQEVSGCGLGTDLCHTGLQSCQLSPVTGIEGQFTNRLTVHHRAESRVVHFYCRRLALHLDAVAASTNRQGEIHFNVCANREGKAAANFRLEALG